MLKKILIITICILVSAVLFLTGCDLVKPTNTSSHPATGGTLNLYGTDPTTLDPALGAEATSIEYILQIFSGLVALDSNLNIVSEIAEKWDVSSNGKTFTFQLRQDAKFQDGRTIKASDFKYSWERACNPATGSSTAATYLSDIVGAKDVLAGRANELSGVKVITDTTLQVTITAPKTYFLFKLTYPVSFVVDENNVKGGGEWWRKPNGTGAFRLKEWAAGSKLILERNNHYYGKVASLSEVDYQMLSGLPMNLYETGDIDVAEVAYLYIDKVTDPAGQFLNQLIVTPELSFYYIGINSSAPPFDDPKVRLAFAKAIDKDKLVSLVFSDTVEKAGGIVPPGIQGFNEALKATEFDPAAAKELLRQSKYGDAAQLPAITFTTAGQGGAVSNYLQAIIYQWRENLGVDVQIRELEPDRYYYALQLERDQLFDLGWIADYPHQQDFLEILFRTGSDINYGGYSNTAVDALLDKASVEPDTATSIGQYQQAEQMLIDDTACIPLWFGQNYTLVKPYVKGYQPSPLGFTMLNLVSVEK
jgi:oligopeptide transport system substrate-binding protein